MDLELLWDFILSFLSALGPLVFQSENQINRNAREVGFKKETT